MNCSCENKNWSIAVTVRSTVSFLVLVQPHWRDGSRFTSYQSLCRVLKGEDVILHVHHVYMYMYMYIREETTTSLSKEGDLGQSVIWNENISCKQTYLGEEKNNFYEVFDKFSLVAPPVHSKYLWLMRLLLPCMYIHTSDYYCSFQICCSRDSVLNHDAIP